jgi:hypothetical protein
MKTMKHYIYKVGAILVMLLAFTLPSKAQTTENYYANIDWQYNFPLGIDFADKSSGWGMNFEGGYFVTENFSIGAFLAYHSNHKYIPRQTIILNEGASLNTDQQHTFFQMPFGATGRYTFNRGEIFQPYISAKLGLQ